MKNVIVERVIHDGRSRVALKCPYDNELILIVKDLPDARWSRSMKYWHISDSYSQCIAHKKISAFTIISLNIGYF
jgi:hypothetical protein